jgi:hypothetical protein
MPHFPKPFYRSARKAWFVQIGSRQISLGTDRDDVPPESPPRASKSDLVAVAGFRGKTPRYRHLPLVQRQRIVAENQGTADLPHLYALAAKQRPGLPPAILARFVLALACLVAGKPKDDCCALLTRQWPEVAVMLHWQADIAPLVFPNTLVSPKLLRDASVTMANPGFVPHWNVG